MDSAVFANSLRLVRRIVQPHAAHGGSWSRVVMSVKADEHHRLRCDCGTFD
jgi:hypothetical protein